MPLNLSTFFFENKHYYGLFDVPNNAIPRLFDYFSFYLRNSVLKEAGFCFEGQHRIQIGCKAKKPKNSVVPLIESFHLHP
jgi:hypothetical protein